MLVKELPDVSFAEDTVLKNAFNLNDYFVDVDNTNLTFSCLGNTSIFITIHQNGTVDLIAKLNWNGFEEIMFRASDGVEFAECTIKVTVISVPDPPEFIKPIENIEFDDDGMLENVLNLNVTIEFQDGIVTIYAKEN